MPDSPALQAAELMAAFAERTGLGSAHPVSRYLWTDAFAVCNFLGLAEATGEARYAELALELIDQVHRTLGRHRPSDRRKGWISGLGEAEGEAHPTRGGLRIGKALPERAPDEPYEPEAEWDRDGQYFHYLAKWMHALDQAARATGQPRFNLWARELAETAQRAFSYQAEDGTLRMYWKMSIDLTRPLVPSMGQHDALDGYVTCVQLRTGAAGSGGGPALDSETRRFAAMLERGELATADPLGIGGLLSDAFRVTQLMARGAVVDASLLEALLASALVGLRHYARDPELQLPAAYRLAFRELGLAIGLHAVERMGRALLSPEALALVEALGEFASLGRTIETFWLEAGSQDSGTWAEHRDINEVMLATSLMPEGFLVLFPEG